MIIENNRLLNKRIEQKLIKIGDELPISKVLGLYTGETGRALLYGYLSLHYNTENYITKTENCLLSVFEELKNQHFNATFCGGKSGILWGLWHLKEKGLIEMDGEFNFIIPELKKVALKYAEENNFDFLHGSAGIIYYLLDIDAIDEVFINTWLKLLYKFAYKNEGKYVWETLINIETGKRAYNLSLSHGISSTIIVLAEIIKKLPDNKLALDLLEGSIKYLLACKLNKTVHSIFPGYIDGTNSNYGSRLSWCYGDLGNAIAFWRAGNLLNNDYWKKLALEIMSYSTSRKELEINGLADAGFCHGTAGVAHIFNRFYKETKIREFDNARWYWLEKTLEMAKWPDGLVGYKVFRGGEGYQNEDNFLEGNTGIAMVLLGFLTDDVEDISWDRCFMLS
jgi:lantibiotic modifying enzyme